MDEREPKLFTQVSKREPEPAAPEMLVTKWLLPAYEPHHWSWPSKLLDSSREPDPRHDIIRPLFDLAALIRLGEMDDGHA